MIVLAIENQNLSLSARTYFPHAMDFKICNWKSSKNFQNSFLVKFSDNKNVFVRAIGGS